MAFNQSYNTAKPVMSTIETNKVLKNTYFLLAMTLAFSAVTAGISMALQLPYFMGLVFTLVSFGLLFVVNKKVVESNKFVRNFDFTSDLCFLVFVILLKKQKMVRAGRLESRRVPQNLLFAVRRN